MSVFPKATRGGAKAGGCRAVSAAVVIAAAGLTVPATTAAAATSSVYITSADSGFSVGTEKTKSVNCGAGDRVYGTGVNVGGGGQVLVDRLEPTDTGVTAHAHVDETGYTGSWNLTVYAVCGPVLTNQKVYSATSKGASAFNTVTETCPSPLSLLGTGWRIDGTAADAGQVVVTGVVPGATSNEVDAYADDTGVPDPWTVTSFAICGTPPTGAALNVPSPAITTTSSTNQGINKVCASGESAIGVGFLVSNTTGDNILTVLKPSAFHGAGLVEGTVFEDEDGYSKNWDTRVYAVCGTF